MIPEIKLDFAAFKSEERRSSAEQDYLVLLERLVERDEAYLRVHPGTPPVYASGVVVRQYFASDHHGFDDVGRMLAQKVGAVDCLACWRAAELRLRGELARVLLKTRRRATDGGLTIVVSGSDLVCPPGACRPHPAHGQLSTPPTEHRLALDPLPEGRR